MSCPAEPVGAVPAFRGDPSIEEDAVSDRLPPPLLSAEPPLALPFPPDARNVSKLERCTRPPEFMRLSSRLLIFVLFFSFSAFLLPGLLPVVEVSWIPRLASSLTSGPPPEKVGVD